MENEKTRMVSFRLDKETIEAIEVVKKFLYSESATQAIRYAIRKTALILQNNEKII